MGVELREPGRWIRDERTHGKILSTLPARASKAEEPCEEHEYNQGYEAVTDAASPGNGVKRGVGENQGSTFAKLRLSRTTARAQVDSPDRDHRLESRMREIRLSGLEGGAAGGQTGRPYPYQ